MSFHLLQLSEQDKLALVGKPLFKVIGSLVVATIFWGLQEMAEIGCQCPWLDVYNQVYGISFLFVPAVVLTLLSVFLHRECLMCCRCQRRDVAKSIEDSAGPDIRHQRSGSWQLITFLKVFYHGWVWIIVVLLDGDCYACIHYFLRLPSNQTVMGHSDTSQSREPPKDDTELIRILKFESRLIGLSLLLVLVAIAVCISCCHVSRCCGKPYYWWEYQQMYLEETERIVLHNLKESASRRAEYNFNNETSAFADGVQGAWEHISSAGFTKIDYPADFRVIPSESDLDSRSDHMSAGDLAETAPKGGSEGLMDHGSEREELGLNCRLGQVLSLENGGCAHGLNGHTGNTGGEEDSGKLGWKNRLQGPLQRIKKQLHKAVGRALKKYQRLNGKVKETHSR